MPGDQDRPCPKCGASSEYVAPETVDVGIGEIPIEPDSWTCPTHGNWCWMGMGDTDLRMEYPDGPSSEGTAIRDALRAALAPAREAHDGHAELDPTCPFCTGAVT